MEPPRNPWERPWRNERRLETSHTDAQAPEAKGKPRQTKICGTSSILAGNFPFLICSLIPAGNRWAGACEQWWLYWMFLTATSLIVSCINSLLLKRDTQEIIRKCCNQHPTDTIEFSATIDYLAHLWQSTPSDPRRQHLPGNEVWGGSAPVPTPWSHEAPVAALTDCCWTVPAQSRALPAQTTVAGLRNSKQVNYWPKLRVASMTSTLMPFLPFM